MTATRSNWKIQAFTSGVPLPYVDAFTADEHDRLRAGLVPRMMEEKWFAFHEAPHLYLHRSWTGRAVYRVTLTPTADDGAVVTEALLAVDSPRTADVAARQAALVAYILRAIMLGQPRPFPQ